MPLRSLFLFLLLPALALSAENPKALLREKLEKIIIPRLKFNEASLEQALDYLRAQSRELDTSPSSSGEKGVKIILRLGDTPNTASINLDVKDLPLSEAIRYVTELSETKFRVEEMAASSSSRSPLPQVLSSPANSGLPF